MCRIAAYAGPPLALGAFMRAPAHSLYKQSWAARELATATVNADGYGMAWLADDERPAVYRNVMPVWADPNLPHLERSLHSRLWLGNVRSATEGLATHLDNTQPFVDDRILFTHNGFIHDFAVSTRRQIRTCLDPEIEAGIRGNTDSEYLFAMIRQHRGPLHKALPELYQALTGYLAGGEVKALLNIIVSDGAELVALRAAINADCPSLYFHPGHAGLEGGQLVASEPFDDDPGWRKLPEQHLLRLRPDQPEHLQPL